MAGAGEGKKPAEKGDETGDHELDAMFSDDADAAEGDDDTSDSKDAADDADDKADKGAEGDDKDDAGSDDDPKRAKLPYEELEKRHANIQKGLKAERAERKRLRDENARMARLIEEVAARAAKLGDDPRPEPAAAQKKAPAPDPDKDPLGYIMHNMSELRAQVERATKDTGERVQKATQSQQLEMAVQRSVMQEEQYAARVPDYHDAVAHLRAARAAEIRAVVGDDITDEQIAESIDNEAMQLAIQAQRSGRNVAELFYTLAKSRGYTAKQAAAEAAEETQRKVEAARKAVKASGSLSRGAGKSADQSQTVQDLLRLMDEDYEAADKLWNKLARAGQLG